jgi:hypothetical protein
MKKHGVTVDNMSLFDTAQGWFFYKKKGKFTWIGDIFFGLILYVPTIFLKIIEKIGTFLHKR